VVWHPSLKKRGELLSQNALVMAMSCTGNREPEPGPWNWN